MRDIKEVKDIVSKLYNDRLDYLDDIDDSHDNYFIEEACKDTFELVLGIIEGKYKNII